MDEHTAPEVPGGRLTGPDAGWRNLHRNLAARLAIQDAEAYARGERQLTVHHGLADDDTGLQQLLDDVDHALASLPDSPVVARFTSAGRFTRWRFQPPMALDHVRVAHQVAARHNPAQWEIEADDY